MSRHLSAFSRRRLGFKAGRHRSLWRGLDDARRGERVAYDESRT